MNTRPTGLLVPITTPFDQSTGDVAPIHLRENARALFDAGVHGLLAAGSTGEAPLLDETEFRNLLEWLRDVVPADKWLIAGAGQESTRATLAACRAAAAESADAALVRPPSYFAPAMTPEALTVHFRRVADESPIPVMLYNMPKYTHISLSDTLFASLVDHPNIWGAKDSSGNLKNFASYRAAAPDWTMFVGSGALYYAALELGAAGAIAATACFAAKLTCEIGLAFDEGDRQRAGAVQERVLPLHTEIVGGIGIAGVKAAMDASGLYGGPVRPPLRDLNDEGRQKVETLLQGAGILSD
jgi:dihydrodipicolinate synthase/N-acetylneuraminate lyase